MIPQRIKLGGFLCYKDEQDISFHGSSLWMLSGLNGSGKSTIFDAVTYAMFGHHRGGATNAGELINKDAKALSVEFEFLVDGQPFRILRTLRRDARGTPKGTQNIVRFDSASDKWVAVPDTNLSDGFKNWVRERIGLNYETFTSSVLLLQGRAEKLLDSKPSGRAEVLAGIVDLERYQKLHERADAQRKTLRASHEAVEAQLTGVPEVTDIELIAADNKIDETEHGRDVATREVERLQNLEFEVRRWAEQQSRLTGLRARWDKGQTLIAESAAIEQAYNRLRELKEVIPHLLVIQEKQSAHANSERESAQFLELQKQSTADRETIEHELEIERKKRSAHQKTLLQDEQKLDEVRQRLAQLAGPLSQLGFVEEQSAKLRKLEGELARLPADADQQLREAQRAFDLCVELSKVTPHLDRLVAARAQLCDALRRGKEFKKTESATRETGEKARKQREDRKTTLDDATRKRLEADDAATEARTLLQQAESAADEFDQLEGARNCRACGQPLTKAHWQEEKANRKKELQTATIRHKDATKLQAAAVDAETTARQQFDAADRELVRLRDEYRDAKKELEQAAKDVERLNIECRDAYSALPATYRDRVAANTPPNWSATTWPTADDHKAMKMQADELETCRRRLREAQDTQSRVVGLQTERSLAQSILDQVLAKLPSTDVSGLREEDKRLRAAGEAMSLQVRGSKKLIQETDFEIDRLNKRLAEVHLTLSRLDSQLRVEQANRAAHTDAIHRARKMIPETWRDPIARAGLAEQNKWKAELEALTRADIEAQFQELAQTRASIDSLQQEMALAEAEADKIAVEARRPVSEIKEQLVSAKKTVAERDDELQKAREEKAVLDRHRHERERLHARSLGLAKELGLATTLAQLLGRDRLQRHLVRTAERQIVDYANSILDRLSGGQLALRLCGGEEGAGAERALELEAFNRTTGTSPINVAFLSGSQRFRVAVSLALGIGQYASRQHRPIESVIIDEGFGCLDRNGRQVMIQELQNLRSHLRCILLVSHQEEFAEAFADGYRFELRDGATHVERIVS